MLKRSFSPVIFFLVFLISPGSWANPENGVLDLTLPQISELLLQLQDKLEAVTIELEDSRKKVDRLEKNPVPLGFIYTQLPHEPDPSIIWPTVGWTQVTHNYAGLFFRVEGGNSSTFGDTQFEEWPRLNRVDYSDNTNGDHDPRSIEVPERGSSALLYTGANSEYAAVGQRQYREFLQFHVSEGEVRPVNTAVRLWKRTG